MLVLFSLLPCFGKGTGKNPTFMLDSPQRKLSKLNKDHFPPVSALTFWKGPFHGRHLAEGVSTPQLTQGCRTLPAVANFSGHMAGTDSPNTGTRLPGDIPLKASPQPTLTLETPPS